jgi:hypothetical protein
MGALVLGSGCSGTPNAPGAGTGNGGLASTRSSSSSGTGGVGGSNGGAASGGSAGVGSTGDASEGGSVPGSRSGGGGLGGDSVGIEDAGVVSDAASDAEDARVPDVSHITVAPICSPPCGAATPACVAAPATCKAIEVIALYTVYEQNTDPAHRAWVREANAWFPMVARANGFTYQALTGWEPLRTITPVPGRVVLFLDDKPTDPVLRAAFESYMKTGGAWIGFHFAGYTSAPETDWDWYFSTLLGSGAYNGNTWRPTSAKLKVEDTAHPVSQGLGALFASAPNEWYAWKVDLRTVSNLKVLLSIDPSSFPLGTGPVPTEIWYSGYYPVVWTNTNYRMLYVNMGHDDMDYGGTNQPLSFAFQNQVQNHMLLNAIQWLGGASKSP